jgi:septal ring factor EnvC (AmiA/AmiB activator)
MNRFISITFLLLATMVQAGELRIVETDDGIVAEYTGTTPDEDSESEKSSLASNSADPIRGEFLSSQFERLKKEADELSRQPGTESENDLAARRALVDEKKRQIEIYTEEMRRMTDKTQAKITDKTRAEEGVPVRQQSQRKQIKKQMNALKMSGTSSPSAAGQE